jgi:hypothetical protein
MRHTRDHTHKSQWDAVPTCIAMFVGWIVTIVIGTGNFIKSSEYETLWFGMMLLFSITVTIIFWEFTYLKVDDIEESDIPQELKRYTCKKKNECEEE